MPSRRGDRPLQEYNYWGPCYAPGTKVKKKTEMILAPRELINHETVCNEYYEESKQCVIVKTQPGERTSSYVGWPNIPL